VLVVFDSNVFHGDVRADRSRLRSILDGAVALGSFSLFVPEVVLGELDKQFQRRTKKALRAISNAIGEQERELRELGVLPPPRVDPDEDDIAGYRAELEARLRNAGAQVLPIPADLTPALAWAINRRKPFNENGAGLPDAVLWLSVLELARKSEDEIVLVARDTDFAEGKPPRLARALREDLVSQGCREDQVRLVFGIDAFAKEVSESLESARVLAEGLVAEGAFDEAIERALMYSDLPQGPLQLGVDLDSEPQVFGWDLESFSIETAAELPGEQLRIEGTATGSAMLSLLIYRGDYYLAAESEDAHFSVSDPNFNEHYIEGESQLEIDVELAIAVGRDGLEAEVEIVDVSLAPLELVGRALHGRQLEELLGGVREALVGRSIDEYEADEAIESMIEVATVDSVYRRGAAAHLIELTDQEGETHTARLRVETETDVTWLVSAPTPFDADHFASLAEARETGAPFLEGHDSAAPLVAELIADWDPEQGWHELQIEHLALSEDETTTRRARGTAAERFLEEDEGGD
jgi:predicted nucleic acid-binding protein